MKGSDALRRHIGEGGDIVFFGGAGVSTASGIPDFRSCDGLFNAPWDDPPETKLSHGYFLQKPEAFFAFYRQRILCPGAKPNAAHVKLAELEAQGRVSAVITQNIDGLHQAAGSKNVLELHGSIHRNHCMRCGRFFDAMRMLGGEPVPLCPCGGTIKPDVVLYGEGLDERTINDSVRALRRARVLIVGGTSLVVYPAAGLIRYFRGEKLILINRDSTPYDAYADLVLHEDIAQVMAEL